LSDRTFRNIEEQPERQEDIPDLGINRYNIFNYGEYGLLVIEEWPNVPPEPFTVLLDAEEWGNDPPEGMSVKVTEEWG